MEVCDALLSLDCSLSCCRDLQKLPETELDNMFYAAIDSLSRMEELYRELIGEQWCYTAGIRGRTWYVGHIGYPHVHCACRLVTDVKDGCGNGRDLFLCMVRAPFRSTSVLPSSCGSSGD